MQPFTSHCNKNLKHRGKTITALDLICEKKMFEYAKKVTALHDSISTQKNPPYEGRNAKHNKIHPNAIAKKPMEFYDPGAIISPIKYNRRTEYIFNKALCISFYITMKPVHNYSMMQ